MELSYSQIEILILLHDSKDHGIHANELVRWRIDFPEIDDILQTLIKKDLVEYELEEHMYYLAYDGFGIVEEVRGLKKPKRITYKSDIEQWGEFMDTIASPKQLQRNILIAIFIFAVFISLSHFLSSKLNLEENTESNHILNEEIFQDVEDQVMQKLDSIKKAKEKED